jgi:hypothetical protein
MVFADFSMLDAQRTATLGNAAFQNSSWSCCEVDGSPGPCDPRPPGTHWENMTYHDLQCEAPKIAKLVYNSNNYGLWYL